LQLPRLRIKHRRRQRRRGIGDRAIARLRENGRSAGCRHANIDRNRLLRTRMSRVAAKLAVRIGAKTGAKVWAKVWANACPAERQARVRMQGGRRTGGARSQPMQQAYHGATIKR
jgi:hypothetical protein